MAHKSDTLAMFQEFHAKVTGESGERIGVLKTDGGGEYRSREYAQYLRKHQIEHEVFARDEWVGRKDEQDHSQTGKSQMYVCTCRSAEVSRG